MFARRSLTCLRAIFLLLTIVGEAAAAVYALPYSKVGVSLIVNRTADGYVYPLSAEGDFGYWVTDQLYVGGAVDYWYARRPTTTRGTDSLQYLSVGSEVGYVRPNPRMWWGLLGGIFYPIISKMTAENGDPYVGTETYLSFRGRLVVGMRIQSWLALTATAGYRRMLLAPVTGPAGTISDDLSTLFLGVGFAFTP